MLELNTNNINDDNINILESNWNNYFNSNISISNVKTYNLDFLFNYYLLQYSKTIDFEYYDNICFCEKVGTNYNVYYVKNNKIECENLDVRSKRKFFNLLGNHEIIINSGFPLNLDGFKDKHVLRYEVVRNFYTSNHTHFFSKSLPFSIDDKTIFFTKIFKDLLFSDINKLMLMKFASYLINTFELGITIDNIILKPNINISHYGRWYWSNTEKIQNDIKAREKVIKKFIKYGNVVNIDLISGEPSILAKLSNSNILYKLIKYRNSLFGKDDKMREMLKNIINIFIHAVESPIDLYNKFKCTNNCSYIEDKLKLSVLDILIGLEEDFKPYDNLVLDSYANDLSITELYRRIVNPLGFIKDNKLIKEHRKFLQGHTHDRVLNLAHMVYNNIGLLPIFTIHDSISYFFPYVGGNIDCNIAKIEECIKKENLLTTMEIIK